MARTGSWRLDLARNELRWSDENHRIFGVFRRACRLTYESFRRRPSGRPRVRGQRLEGCDEGAPYDIEHRLVVNGEIRWVKERVELEFDASGKPIAGMGCTQDISDSKRAEAALAASESRFRLAMEAVAGMVFDWDRATIRSTVRPGLERFLVGGRSPKFDRRWWHARIHPDDLRRIRPMVLACLKQRSDRCTEYRLLCDGGRWAHIPTTSGSSAMPGGGGPSGGQPLTDISARKEVEAALMRINDTSRRRWPNAPSRRRAGRRCWSRNASPVPPSTRSIRPVRAG